MNGSNGCPLGRFGGLLLVAVAVVVIGVGRAGAATPHTPSLERSAVCFQTRGFTVVMRPGVASSFGTTSVFGAWKGFRVVLVAILPSASEAERVAQRQRQYLAGLGTLQLTARQIRASVRRTGTVVHYSVDPASAYLGDIERCTGQRGSLTNGETPVGGRFATESYARVVQLEGFQARQDDEILTLATKCLALGSPNARRRDGELASDRNLLAHPCGGLTVVLPFYRGIADWVDTLPDATSACEVAGRAVGPAETKLIEAWADVRFAISAPDLDRKLARARKILAASKRVRAAFLEACR